MTQSMISRRDMLTRSAAGFGMLGLASVLSDERRANAESTLSSDPLAPKVPHFAAKAKHLIFLFMNGGPSHVDTFDPKTELVKQAGKPGPGGNYMPSPFKFQQRGECGLPISEIYPHLGEYMDDLCVIRSMYTSTPNHEPGQIGRAHV